MTTHRQFPCTPPDTGRFVLALLRWGSGALAAGGTIALALAAAAMFLASAAGA